jgi:signal transduction histidine kinase
MLKLLRKLNETNFVLHTKSHFTEVHWDDILKEITQDLLKMDPDQKVKIFFENQIKKSVICDEQLLSIIILNLLENSIVFHNEINPYVKLTISGKAKTLHITVVDNGIGIKESIQQKVFGMFYRGSEKSIGNGLGLFLVKKAVDLLSGKIEIQSIPNELTSIHITIPLTLDLD